jgi:hypothetical protein
MYELIYMYMFRAFLLNRWIYAFVSLYKSLNILKEQYNWNLFMNIKYFFLKKFKARAQ